MSSSAITNNNNHDNDTSPSASSSSSSPSSPSSPITPLHNSSRLKGYITLFVSALYNFLAASERSTKAEIIANADLSTLNLKLNENLCMSLDYLDHLGDLDLVNGTSTRQHDNRPTYRPHRLNYAMTCSMITVIVAAAIILCHVDFCTPLRKNVWPKAFGQHSKIEMCILLSLTLFWCISTWFNTTIRGPAGEGKDQSNLYFSSWICLWACFWTLESWSTTSGRASFERFVRSWPNRCPLWIVTFLLSLLDFLFALDLYRNWDDEGGAAYNPYVYKLYSEVREAEWNFLFAVTGVTFIVSLAWALAEIFRESRSNVESMKSDVENYVEGLTAHVLCGLWIILVCIVTMPGGAASLLGNLYFTTWSTLFSVISTLIWYHRDWRREINQVIREEEEKYEHTKKIIRKREEKRMARMAEEEEEAKKKTSDVESTKVEEDDDNDDGILCENDPVDDDITISIGSDYHTSSPERPRVRIASFDGTPPPAESDAPASSSIFASVLSYFYSPDENAKSNGDGD